MSSNKKQTAEQKARLDKYNAENRELFASGVPPMKPAPPLTTRHTSAEPPAKTPPPLPMTGKSMEVLKQLDTRRQENKAKFLKRLSFTHKRGPRYYILDGDLVDQLVSTDTVPAAISHILTDLAHHRQPYFVADGHGDLLCLVYAGAVWR